MFFRAILFVLFFSPLFLIGSVPDQNALCSKGTTPHWVKSCDFPLDAVAVKPSQVNLQYLLIDTQRNWEEKTLYRHFAVKTLTQIGVENISQLNIDFDPSYCQVVMHAIRIFRGGEWFDRLENSRHHVIQREKDLEQNLYHGDLTLVYFLDDIREGDVIEYSYSLVGQHPLFASHYTEAVYLQRDFTVEKITHRLLGQPDLSFLIKPVNTTLESRIVDLSPSLREWSWEAVETSPYIYEADQPAWHNPPAHIEMSQYRTWKEVAQKISPLYILPSDFAQTSPSEMQALVGKWKASTKSLPERALLALRFVQDEVRYLGIEEGMGAFQPNDPSLTFLRRFGDCKDKTFLLHALLQLMDIPSTPLLVHTYRGKRLPEVLPAPVLFNHLVLQLEVDGTTYWVDPTSSLQGGSLQTNCFPGYEWGLLLTDNIEALTPLPKTFSKNPTEIDTSFILESEDSALLKIKSIFYGAGADRFRRSLAWYGQKHISDGALSEMQEVYGAATLDSPMETLDDRENNIFTLIESYRLPTQKRSDQKVMEIFSYVLRSYLHNRVNPERTTPYAISYPLWVKEHIHIENPFIKWTLAEGKYKHEHESLLYTLSQHIENNTADFDLELKHLQDHIPQTSLRDYWNTINDIERNAPFKITIADGPAPIGEPTALHFYLTIGIFLWPVIYFVSRKKRPTQDQLSFYLSKFQRFYIVITVVSALLISDDSIGAGIKAGVITFVVFWVCNNIYLKRSVKIVQMSLGFLVLQASYLLYFIFMTDGLEYNERYTATLVCYVYLGTCWAFLNKAKAFLSEEKKSAGTAA